MRICPDCRAHNPERLERCYACGQSLTKRREGEPLPGERTYPCLNCGAPLPYTAKNCPTCGRLAAPPESPLPTAPADVLLSPLPTDWQIEPLPDGTVRLSKNLWGRLRSDGSVFSALLYLIVPVVFFGIITGRTHYPRRHAEPSEPWFALLIVGILILVSILAALWAFFGREELRVGPGFLERRRRLFGLGSIQRLSGMAVLAAASITTGHTSRYGPRTYRYLELQNLGKHIRLDSRDVTRMADLLTAVAHLAVETSHPSDDIATLGRYLSARTGWPFHDLNFR